MARSDLDDRPQTCSLSPADAESRGVADGDVVRVFIDRSSLTAVAKIDAALREGVVAVPKGVWHRNTREGRGANALIGQGATVVSGGAVYNDARVQVERVAAAATP